MKSLPFFWFLGLAALLAACQPQTTLDASDTPTPETAPMINSLDTILQDMSLPHESLAHGVPLTYDWARNPRIGMGNDPGDFRAMTAWGQVYEAAQGNPAVNTRVHLREIRAFYLSKADGQWRLWQSSSSLDGAYYAEDFVGDVNKPADARQEPEGGISVKPGGGFNYHFWPTSERASIDPQDIAGVFTTVQARLVLEDPSAPDDRLQARFLLSMGGDYWLSLSASWDQWKTNGDIAIGRFKYVTIDWQAFNMTTLDESDLRNNPPPLE